MCGFLVDSGSGYPKEVLERASEKIQHRGPDAFDSWSLGGRHFFFHRLAIMDEREEGMQPFVVPDRLTLVCNGEIYNEDELKGRVQNPFDYQSTSDCEVLLPYFLENGIQKLSTDLDAEYALVVWDHRSGTFSASRDPIGIRPMFYGYAKTNSAIMFASEAKALMDLCGFVRPFPPGHTYQSDTDTFVPFWELTHVTPRKPQGFQHILKDIRERLELGVRKRLRSDVPVGFLLSGGLDSSLVCAIASRILDKPITTFSVGIDRDPIDTGYARQVADYLGTDHHEILFTREDVFEALTTIIYHLETWDVTTVRASVGMYLVCKYIKENTDIKVLLTGEVSDELFGYKYTDFAPDAAAFQKEAEKRVSELYVYDVLRADRCISAHGLEARVPFGDLSFVDLVMSLPPELKMNHYGIGKYLLREAFVGSQYLPDSILFREKAAFSDAVGHSMVDELKKFAEETYTQADLAKERRRYSFHPPISKEALMYRHIFDTHFEGHAGLIPAYWLPNREWENCNVDDPSARVLPNYGESGSQSHLEECRSERMAG